MLLKIIEKSPLVLSFKMWNNFFFEYVHILSFVIILGPPVYKVCVLDGKIPNNVQK